MRENCTPGTVRGVPGNRHPYRGVAAADRPLSVYERPVGLHRSNDRTWPGPAVGGRGLIVRCCIAVVRGPDRESPERIGTGQGGSSARGKRYLI